MSTCRRSPSWGSWGRSSGLLAAVPVVWLVWRGLRSAAEETRRWAWAAVFTLLFLGLFNVFDFQMNVPAVLLVGALPVAWLDASSEKGLGLGRAGERSPRGLGGWRRSPCGSACAVAVVVLFRAENVASTHQQAVAAVYAGDWDEARSPATDAYAADDGYPAYAITYGLVASADGDWEAAADAYRFAAETDEMAQSWLGLAQAQEALGEPDDEVVELDRAGTADRRPATVHRVRRGTPLRPGRSDRPG